MRWASPRGMAAAACRCLVILCLLRADHAAKKQARSGGKRRPPRGNPAMDIAPQQLDGSVATPQWFNASAAQIANAAAAITGPKERQAEYFEIHGRSFWNKSLGLDQLPGGMLGHQCSASRPAGPSEHTLTYTPNRRWPDNPAEGRSAIVMAVGGEPKRFLKRIHETWVTWRGHFTPVIRYNTAMVILLDSNFFADMIEVEHELELTRLDCTEHRQACDVAAGLDQGYTLYSLETFVVYHREPGKEEIGEEVFETEEPFLVFIALYDFPHPYWIDRHHRTEAEIIGMDWRTQFCNHAPYAYTKFTNWYSYHMLSELRILDFFDYWWKIDDDVRWFNRLPLDLTAKLVAERRIFFHTEMNRDPVDCIGHALGDSIKLYLNIESEICGRPLSAAAHDKHWWKDDTVIYLSEFVGGWLGLYTAPELLEYGRIWNYFDSAMWRFRWGDQQFWTKANGLFDNGSNILDLSYLKQVNTSQAIADIINTSMMFYHG